MACSPSFASHACLTVQAYACRLRSNSPILKPASVLCAAVPKLLPLHPATLPKLCLAMLLEALYHNEASQVCASCFAGTDLEGLLVSSSGPTWISGFGGSPISSQF